MMHWSKKTNKKKHREDRFANWNKVKLTSWPFLDLDECFILGIQGRKSGGLWLREKEMCWLYEFRARGKLCLGEGRRCKMVLCGFKHMDNLYVVRASYTTRMYPSNVLIRADRQLFDNCHIQDGSGLRWSSKLVDTGWSSHSGGWLGFSCFNELWSSRLS